MQTDVSRARRLSFLSFLFLAALIALLVGQTYLLKRHAAAGEQPAAPVAGPGNVVTFHAVGGKVYQVYGQTPPGGSGPDCRFVGEVASVDRGWWDPIGAVYGVPATVLAGDDRYQLAMQVEVKGSRDIIVFCLGGPVLVESNRHARWWVAAILAAEVLALVTVPPVLRWRRRRAGDQQAVIDS